MALVPDRLLTGRLVGIAAGLAGLAVFGSTQADPDLWGHVRYGLDIWQTRTLPSVDPYSFTQDVPWVNHEWLSELQMGAAWLAGGTAGLVLLKAALVTAVFALAWSGLGGTDFTVRLGLMLVLALGAARLTATLRPQLWTFLCLAVLCRLLLERHRRARWWLPALFVVWVNVHGGWIVGLGVFGVASAIEWWCEPAARRTIALQAAACLLATLVNPYGWGMWDFIGETVRFGRDITEWQPLSTVHPLIWGPWLAAAGLGIWLALRRDPTSLASAGALAMLAWSSFRVERIVPLFVLGAVLLAAPAVRRRWPERPVPVTLAPTQARTAAALLVVAALVVATVVGRSSLGCIPVVGTWAPDAEVARRLERAAAGRLVVFFDWGQYALWHWGPALQVSMDGRRETIYSDARLAEHAAILDGRPEGLQALGAWRAEYVWLPRRNGATEAWLAGNGYRLEVLTDTAFLAVRSDLPIQDLAEARTGRRCFPF